MSTYFSAAGENAALNGSGGLGGAGSYISLHSASPGTTGANELSGGAYARAATTWGAPAGGVSTGAQVTINVPSGVTVGFFGVWNAASSGTYNCGGTCPTQAYPGPGTYVITPALAAQG
jgi:hypothetical protein